VFVEDIIGLSRARRIAPLKSDFDLDITVSMHSDSPVTEVYPLSYLRTAVTRFMGDTHTPLGEEEIIPLEKALTCITLNPAKQLGIDHITGTLEVGKNADMVMLDSDPQNIPPSLLDTLKVEATWVKGKQAYGV
jgi:predicted amidohydrolase YtcJ